MAGRTRRVGAVRAAVVAALVGACSPQPPDEAPFELVAFRQSERFVALNEELIFHFSLEIDRTSVTRETVRILDPSGADVAGDFQLRGSVLTFRPQLPRRADLTDGGLRPGLAYSVELIGYPRPDGLRARSGTVLRDSPRAGFRTVAREGSAPLFADPFLQQPSALAPRRGRLGPLDPIELAYGEALDPRTVRAEDFALFSLEDASRIPLRVELVENRRDGSTLSLRPLSTEVALGGLRALSAGQYFVVYQRGAVLRTLGGRPVLRLGSEPWSFVVQEPSPQDWQERFDTTVLRGREAVEEADGTAAWTGDGAVRVRFPAEAGDGRDGRVAAWSSAGDPDDVHASRLVVPAGAVWDLSERQGLVVLRSQGALVVEGTLRRSVRAGTAPIAESLRSPDRRLLANAGPLEAWIERVRAEGHDWTVLVAGGDVRVLGSIELDGPLVVIAGGWIRVRGRVEAREVWKSLEGGENIVAPDGLRVAPFEHSPPRKNPLVEPLRYAVLSNPLRPETGVLRWGGARVEGEAGDGSFRVRFLGLRDLGPSAAELFGPLDDPTLLADCPAVRFLVELEIDPAEGVWNPPRVDLVSLQWTAPAPSAEGRPPEER